MTSRACRIAMFFSLTAWIPLPSAAQEAPHRNEFAAYVGEGHMGGKEGTYGKGAEEGVSVEFRRSPRLGFMADINRLNHSGTISNVNGSGDHWEISGTAVQTSGSLVYHFYNAPLQPYVFGGAGALRSSRAVSITGDFQVYVGACFPKVCLNIQPTRFENRTVKETTAAFHAGAGVRVPIAWGFSFRPEVRLVHAGDVHLAHAVFSFSYGW